MILYYLSLLKYGFTVSIVKFIYFIYFKQTEEPEKATNTVLKHNITSSSMSDVN